MLSIYEICESKLIFWTNISKSAMNIFIEHDTIFICSAKSKAVFFSICLYKKACKYAV